MSRFDTLEKIEGWLCTGVIICGCLGLVSSFAACSVHLWLEVLK